MRLRPLVLVADDDEDIRALVTWSLRRSGFDVVTAEDGEQAIDVAREHSPDLAILDLRMPGLTGLEVARLLRASKATAATRIILLTARVEDVDVSEGLAAGADDYVKKPFSPQDLRDRAAALLEGREPTAA